jgi:hypothetical protein
MSEESERLMDHIAGLSDMDLLRMVYFDNAQYRSEAITYAKAEIAWNLAADITAGLFICLLFGRLFKSLVEKIRSYLEPA